MILGAITSTDLLASITAVAIPVTVRWLVSGSYSKRAPSGKMITTASADCDGAVLASEKMAGRIKPVVSSPPILSTITCSPTDGADQKRTRPARRVNQLSQSVSRLPILTRHNPLARLTSETVPMRIMLANRRLRPAMRILMRPVCRLRARAACYGFCVRDGTKEKIRGIG